MGWPSLTDLEEYIGHTVTIDRAQLLLEQAKASCRNVARAIGADLEQTSDDEVVLDGNGADTMLLPGWPVTAVSSVVVGDDTLDSDDYEWSRVGELTRATVFTNSGWPGASPRTFGAWPAGKRNITVTYTHGLVSVPDDIKAVALSVAARMLINPQGLQQFAADGVTVGFGGGVGPQHAGRSLLDSEEAATVLRAIQ